MSEYTEINGYEELESYQDFKEKINEAVAIFEESRRLNEIPLHIACNAYLNIAAHITIFLGLKPERMSRSFEEMLDYTLKSKENT